MPIKNYTTEIPATRTAANLVAMLAEHGASAIQIEYEQREPVALSFAVESLGRTLHFRLPTRPEGVLRTLVKDRVPPRYQTSEHARRVAWRIAHDWTAAQLALIEAGGSEMAEAFLPSCRLLGRRKQAPDVTGGECRVQRAVFRDQQIGSARRISGRASTTCATAPAAWTPRART